MSACRRIQIEPYLSPYTKLKSKLIKDIDVKADVLNLIEQKVWNSLELFGTGDNFLNRTPVAQALRSTIDKWDLMKLKSFYKTKDSVNRTKRQPTNWQRIFTNPTSVRGLISKIYKELKKLETNIPNSPIFKIWV